MPYAVFSPLFVLTGYTDFGFEMFLFAFFEAYEDLFWAIHLFFWFLIVIKTVFVWLGTRSVFVIAFLWS